MRDLRLRSLQTFEQKVMPNWGVDLTGINFDDVYYYVNPTKIKSRKWEDVPIGIRNTYEKIGVPEAERKFLAGLGRNMTRKWFTTV